MLEEITNIQLDLKAVGDLKVGMRNSN